MLPITRRSLAPLLSPLFLLAGCSAADEVIDHQIGFGATPTLATSCGMDADCEGELTCSAGGESAGQCTVEGCSSDGAGQDHGCPDGAYCYVYGDDQGYDCARTCQTDDDCDEVNPALVCRADTSQGTSGPKICVVPQPYDGSELNSQCSDNASCDPALELICGGDEGESSYQCIVAGCPSVGPGPEHGCADDAFCYVFDGDDGHYCTRTCQTDDDCQAINADLVCRERTSTEAFDLRICVPADDAASDA
jgi:hypothetical protein